MLSKTSFSFLVVSSLALSTGCQPKKKESSDVLSGGSGSTTGGSSGGSTSGSSGGGSTTLTQGPYGIMFVTTAVVDGGQGIAAMDALCTTEKTAKNFAGTFKALVYDGASRKHGGADWPLIPYAEYRREDRTTVIMTATAAGHLVLPFTNSITATAKYPWTGFYAYSNPGVTFGFTSPVCNGWVNNSPLSNTSKGNTAMTGLVPYVDQYGNNVEDSPFNYSNSGTESDSDDCDQTHPIICVQTTFPAPTGAKKVFLSTTSINGSSGVSGMDALCASSATTKGYSGVYKAMVSTDGASGPGMRRACAVTGNCTTTTENVDWVLRPDTYYVREGGTQWTDVIGKTNSAGIFLFPLFKSFLTTNDTYWTGLGPS